MYACRTLRHACIPLIFKSFVKSQEFFLNIIDIMVAQKT